MDRREFLRLTGIGTAAVVQPGVRALAAGAPADGWRTFEVTTRVEILFPEGITRAWIPTPLADDRPFQKALGNSYEAQGGTTDFVEASRYGVGMIYAEWPAGVEPVLEMKSRFATRNVAADLSRPFNPRPESLVTLMRYTAPTRHMPTDGVVKELSSSIVKGASGDVEKARAIYEWIADNTYRDGNVRGCGTGDVKFMIENHAWGGKCADINALFVALARAEGVPARDVYGIRVADSALGYKSLGKSGDITRAQHCRAEFYSKAHGWVPVDPADVRKVILEEQGGKKPDDPMVLAARKRLFGAWEMNWLAYNYGNEIALPHSARPPITFLMYPQSETAQGRLDSLDPDNFKYVITAKEIA